MLYFALKPPARIWVLEELTRRCWQLPRQMATTLQLFCPKKWFVGGKGGVSLPPAGRPSKAFSTISPSTWNHCNSLAFGPCFDSCAWHCKPTASRKSCMFPNSTSISCILRLCNFLYGLDLASICGVSWNTAATPFLRRVAASPCDGYPNVVNN